MLYAAIEFSDGFLGYQEMTTAGAVTRLTDLDGNTIVGKVEGYVDHGLATPAWAVPDPVPEPQPEPAPVTNIITKLAYMKRFTDTELATIFTAAKTEVMIEVWLEKFKVAEDIDLADPETMAGVQALEAFGLIGAGRAAEILGA